MHPLMIAAAVAVLSWPYDGPGLTASVTAISDNQATTEQELIALDKKFDEARRKGDTAFVSDLLTDDFLRVTPAAAVQSKADVLKAMTAQSANPAPTPPADAVPPTYTVQLHGDTAVMVHSNTGDDVVPASAVMHVFVKQQGRWKMAGWGNINGRPTTEQSINNAGYQLMEEGKLKEAIEVFKMNVQLYPDAWNTYDSLGEAFAKAGDTALAIQNYEKSIQLNPKNELGKAALAKLRGK
jgi:tetratricopeptide (TPR) repeat protein